jgi:hypothetical protein
MKTCLKTFDILDVVASARVNGDFVPLKYVSVPLKYDRRSFEVRGFSFEVRLPFL